MGSKNPDKSTAIFGEDLEKLEEIALSYPFLCLNFVVGKPSVVWVFVPKNKFFPSKIEVTFVDFFDQAGTLHPFEVIIF